jgi:EmrB/QacA subfamily drug resistance transporter
VNEIPSRSLPSGAIDPSTSRLFLTIFPSIMLPMFLAVADQTIVASALPAIAADTGQVERISWVVVSYLLATTIAAPVYGYLGDTFGRRRLMFVAIAVFIAASILCASAPTIATLSASRVLQGLGGGGLMSLSQALVGEIVPARQRGHFQGYMAANATASAAFGPVAGGWLTVHFGWRSIFLVNVPLGFVAMLLALRIVARPGNRSGGWTFDSFGLILLVATVVPILVALQMIERPNLENLGGAALLAMVSIAAGFRLTSYEGARPQPLIPVQLLRRRLVWMGDALVVCHGAALTSLVAFLPLFLRVVHGATVIESGFLLLPVTAGIGVGAIVTGRLVTRTGRTMIFPGVGLIVATLLLLVFAFNASRLPLFAIGCLLSTASAFMGTVMGVVQVTVQGAAGPHQLGAAAGSVQLSRSVGAAFGTALFGTVVFASLFWIDPTAGSIFTKLVDAGPDALNSLSETARQTFLAHSSAAFRAGFLLIVVFTTSGALLAWANPSRRV